MNQNSPIEKAIKLFMIISLICKKKNILCKLLYLLEDSLTQSGETSQVVLQTQGFQIKTISDHCN
ncbi:hypothetical protein BpHYR1_029244 [Brachionus plicatilis]|uniref:Uncharacterized protein n=1 Tax=Brachionus plicatilis TaxID=10195 RepID=A0A3M7PZN5_BRAPC|nr:hypothetical protein BpHYR1_029244 [Brachionus plicatilis]